MRVHECRGANSVEPASRSDIYLYTTFRDTRSSGRNFFVYSHGAQSNGCQIADEGTRSDFTGDFAVAVDVGEASKIKSTAPAILAAALLCNSGHRHRLRRWRLLLAVRADIHDYCHWYKRTFGAQHDGDSHGGIGKTMNTLMRVTIYALVARQN